MNKMIPSESIHADENGNAVIGKNLEVGGAVFTLNNKACGIMPVRFFSSGGIEEEGFIFSDSLPTLEKDRSDLYVSGLWLCLVYDKAAICPIIRSFTPNSPKTNIVDGVLFIGEEDQETFANLFKPFATL